MVVSRPSESRSMQIRQPNERLHFEADSSDEPVPSFFQEPLGLAVTSHRDRESLRSARRRCVRLIGFHQQLYPQHSLNVAVQVLYDFF